MNSILTIAGSDSGAGAGIQADLKTAMALGVYATTVITALTAQNTVQVRDILEVPSSFVSAQLACVFEDLPPDAVKIGMLGMKENILAAAEGLKTFGAKNIVVDPVLCSTSGRRLLDPAGLEALQNKLFPLARIITPNVPEAELLWHHKITSRREMEQAAGAISNRAGGAAVLVKGGHLTGAADVLFDQNQILWFEEKPLKTFNTHGTGCTLSSAMACFLAKGFTLEESVFQAKQFLTGAIGAGLNLGKGPGPLHHGYLFSELL